MNSTCAGRENVKLIFLNQILEFVVSINDFFTPFRKVSKFYKSHISIGIYFQWRHWFDFPFILGPYFYWKCCFYFFLKCASLIGDHEFSITSWPIELKFRTHFPCTIFQQWYQKSRRHFYVLVMVACWNEKNVQRSIIKIFLKDDFFQTHETMETVATNRIFFFFSRHGSCNSYKTMV